MSGTKRLMAILCMATGLASGQSETNTLLESFTVATNGFNETEHLIKEARRLRDGTPYLGGSVDVLIYAVEALHERVKLLDGIPEEIPMPIWQTESNAVYATSETRFEIGDGQMVVCGDTTNMILRLVREGVVCAVIGHRWESGCGKPGCLVLHIGNVRHCVICGKVEVQEIGEWK